MSVTLDVNFRILPTPKTITNCINVIMETNCKTILSVTICMSFFLTLIIEDLLYMDNMLLLTTGTNMAERIKLKITIVIKLLGFSEAIVYIPEKISLLLLPSLMKDINILLTFTEKSRSATIKPETIASLNLPYGLLKPIFKA